MKSMFGILELGPCSCGDFYFLNNSTSLRVVRLYMRYILVIQRGCFGGLFLLPYVNDIRKDVAQILKEVMRI
jgi:hypothetical protein